MLAAGEAVPITLFYTNINGPGSASCFVGTPDGQMQQDTTPFLWGLVGVRICFSRDLGSDVSVSLLPRIFIALKHIDMTSAVHIISNP